MNYDPNEQIPQPEAGIYKFAVKTVEFKSNGSYVTEEIDKNGRPYIKPTLAVFIPGTNFTWKAKPFLSTHPKMVFKLNHLREIAGQELVAGDFDAATLEGASGYGRFVPSNEGYGIDLEVLDFIPQRKIDTMTPEEKAIFDLAVAKYADDCPIQDEPVSKQDRLDKAREMAASITGKDNDIPF